jgi:hypothetical protein
VNLFALLGSAVAEAQYLAIVRNALLVREEELKPLCLLGLWLRPSTRGDGRKAGGSRATMQLWVIARSRCVVSAPAGGARMASH